MCSWWLRAAGAVANEALVGVGGEPGAGPAGPGVRAAAPTSGPAHGAEPAAWTWTGSVSQDVAPAGRRWSHLKVLLVALR